MIRRAVVLSEDGDLSTRLEPALRSAGFLLETVRELEALRHPPLLERDLLVVAGGPGRIVELRKTQARCLIIVVARAMTTDNVLRVFREGANDVVITDAVGPFLDSLQRLGAVQANAPKPDATEFSFGSSLAMREIERHARRAAECDSTVLITGETGTGKEVTASFIHANSTRRTGRMLSLNCAAIPETLLESELFGYDKGAFTGAVRNRPGAFELAHRGTVFLDEVGELPLAGQAKLLRVLENRAVRPLGGRVEVPVDVRIVAATNQPLERQVDLGRFRADLYFRLNVVRLDLPPLRDRREDLENLIKYHLRELCRHMSRSAVVLSEDLLARLMAYDWPGNIRELRNFLEGTLVHSANDFIDTEDVPHFVKERLTSRDICGSDERNRIIEALKSSDWNKSRAADFLHCSRMTLYRKMARYRIAG